jgi:hypothetical protein
MLLQIKEVLQRRNKHLAKGVNLIHCETALKSLARRIAKVQINQERLRRIDPRLLHQVQRPILLHKQIIVIEI